MRISRSLLVGCGLLLALALLAGCGGTPTEAVKPGTAGSAAQEPALAIDEAKAVEKEIKAAEGGLLELQPEDADLVRISFPRDSLDGDTTIKAAPLTKAPIADETVLPGFLVEDAATGKGPEMKYGAIITIALAEKLPKTASLVRYKDDGSGYDVVPTEVATKGNKTQLTARVEGFSEYGVMDVSQSLIDQAAEDADNMASYDWVIYIDDTSDVPGGGSLKQTVSIDLSARNSGGGIVGGYKGSATAETTNEGDVGGAHLSATAQSKSSALGFELAATIEPALEPQSDDDPLASLTEGGPDYSGDGTISMSTAGSGTIGGASGGFSNDSTLPIHVSVIGPQVRLAVDFPQGTVYFDGYIRGEGRK